MKKLILVLLLGFTVLFSTSSCITSAYAQDVVISDNDGDGDIDFSVVIRYGTPYYFEGSLLYYLYNGWYYYPYLHNNYYYYYRYTRPLPPPRHGHRFFPGINDRPHFRHHVSYKQPRSLKYGTRPPRVNDTFTPHNRRGNDGYRNGGINNNRNIQRTNPQRGNINRPSMPMRGNGGTISRPSMPTRSGGNAPHGGGGRFGGRR